MINLIVCCAMCCREKTLTIEPAAKVDVEKELKAEGWLSQQNGDHFDIYCSKKCAE